jgi:glycerol-3-phosphate dehydrogenase subunit B
MTANRYDLLVIGEGLAGITAAATANAHGQRVMLVSTGPGNFVLGTACLDLNGIDADSLGFAGCAEHEIEEAIRFFVELTSSAGCAFEGGVGESRLVPTILGTFQLASLAPRLLWKGDPRSAGSVVIAGIDGMSGFDADFVAERLSFHSRRIGSDVSYRSVMVRLADRSEHALSSVEVASRFDRDAIYRNALVAALRGAVQGAELVIVPGVLGMKSEDDDIGRMEKEIGCAICELPTMPPSVPGMRLLYRLERHLMKLGIELCTGFSVQKLCIEGDHCSGIILDTPGRPRHIQADSVIVAGGKFSHLLDGQPLDRQLPARSVRVNQQLQPLNNEGVVVARNLFECGSALEKSKPLQANAIAILTGYRAGMLASTEGVLYARR